MELLAMNLLVAPLHGDRLQMLQQVILTAVVENRGTKNFEHQFVHFRGTGAPQFVSNFSWVGDITHMLVSVPRVEKQLPFPISTVVFDGWSVGLGSVAVVYPWRRWGGVRSGLRREATLLQGIVLHNEHLLNECLQVRHARSGSRLGTRRGSGEVSLFTCIGVVDQRMAVYT